MKKGLLLALTCATLLAGCSTMNDKPVHAHTTATAPMVRLFELKAAEQHLQAFDTAGRDNMGTSVATEDGTLAMYAASLKAQPATHYILEIYRDEAAYKTHAASAHFRRYLDMAKTGVVGRKAWETNPQFLAEKPDALRVTSPTQLSVRLAELTIDPSQQEAFRKIVIDEMQQSMAKEPGVLAMYAVTLKEDPAQWRFFEIYASEAACQAHRQSPHFQQYLAQTASMLKDRKLHELDGRILMNKGSLKFVSE